MSTGTDDDLGTVQRALDGLDHALIHRYPHVAGPVFLAGSALGATAAVHAAAGTWAWAGWGPWIVTGLAAVVCLLGLESVAHLPGRREKWWAVSLWLGGGAWCSAAAWWGPFTGPAVLGVGPLLWAWLGLVVVGWPPWFKHRRIRRGVEVSAEILAWDGDAVGLPRVELLTAGAGADGHSWWARIRPQRKGEYTLAKLRQQIPRIAARYDASISDVAIEAAVDGKEGEYLLRVQTKRREQVGATYAVPDERPSLRVPFEIGVLADHVKPLMSELWRRNHGGVDGLCAGAKGGGKTNLARRVAGQAIAAHDGLSIICDLKPGSPDYSDLGRRGAYVFATTQAQVDMVMQALLVLCEVRGRNRRPDRKILAVQVDETASWFTPTRPEPVDPAETDPDKRDRLARRARNAAAETDRQRLADWDRLVSISRAFDMALRVYTQRGRAAKLGGADTRTALLAGEVCGFYSAQPADSALISGDHEFDLTSLPLGVPGECLLANSVHQEPTRGTQHHFTDEAAAELLDRFGADQGDLHDDELEALRDAFGARWDNLRASNRVPATPIVVDVEPVAEPEPAGPPRMTREQSLEAVWDALAACPKPVLARDVATAVGKSERIVRERLQQLVTDGRAEREGQARWVKYSAVRS